MLRNLIAFKTWGPLSIVTPTTEDLCWRDCIIKTPLKPGFVRVRLRVPIRREPYDFPYDPYGGFDCTSFLRGEHIQYEEDFELDLDGGLDLRRVGKRWGIERLTVIDVEREEEFQTYDPYRLSPVAVRILSECQGHVTMTERLTVMTRQRKAFRKDIRGCLTNLKYHSTPKFDSVNIFLLTIAACSLTLAFWAYYYPEQPTQVHHFVNRSISNLWSRR